MKLFYKKNNTGFTLVETLVAVTILVMSVTGLLIVTGEGLQKTSNAQTRLQAQYLAQEGIELVRATRDTYFIRQQAEGNTPTMAGITNFCNAQSSSTLYVKDAQGRVVNCSSWTYPDVSGIPKNSHNPATIAGPLGNCNYVSSNNDLGGIVGGCNLNFDLDAHRCAQFNINNWKLLADTRRSDFPNEACAIYFYNDEGVFRSKFTYAHTEDQNGDMVPNPIPPDENADFTGFARQIFVNTASAGGVPTAGLKVTSRVYWIEGSILKMVELDDFLTDLP